MKIEIVFGQLNVSIDEMIFYIIQKKTYTCTLVIRHLRQNQSYGCQVDQCLES